MKSLSHSRSPDRHSPTRIPKPIKSRSPSRSPSRERQARRPEGRRFGGKVGKRKLPDIGVVQGDSRRTGPSSAKSPRPHTKQTATRKRRKLPRVGQVKAPVEADSDVESGYGEVEAISEAVSTHDLSVQTDTATRTLSFAATQTDASLTAWTQTTSDHSTRQLPVLPSTPSTDRQPNPLARSTSFADSSVSGGSQDNVVLAVLEADRAMQEMIATEALRGGVAPFGMTEWYQEPNRDVEEESDEDGRPVSIMLLDDNVTLDDAAAASSSALTDSAKQALKQAPKPVYRKSSHRQSTPHRDTSTNMGSGEQPYVNVQVTLSDKSDTTTDDTTTSMPNGLDAHGNARSPDNLWMADSPNLSSQTVRRQVEVVEQHITSVTHVLKPHTSLASDTDNEDAMSWGSLTEPEPRPRSVATINSGTQTPRHRTTQTPEDATTQTKILSHRRQLPLVPGRVDQEDIDSDDAGLLLEHFTLPWRTSIRSTGSQTDLSKAPWKQDPNKNKKLPITNSQATQIDDDAASGLSDTNVDDSNTNSALMQTIVCRETGSLRSTEGRPNREGTLSLRATRDIPEQPAYLKEYQEYIESFDGTASGPFVPGQHGQQSVFIDNENLHNTVRTKQSPSQSPTRTDRSFQQQKNDAVNMPKLVLRDNAGEEIRSERRFLPTRIPRPVNRKGSRYSDGNTRSDSMSPSRSPSKSYDTAQKNTNQSSVAVGPDMWPNVSSMAPPIATNILINPGLHNQRHDMTDSAMAAKTVTKDASFQTPLDCATQTPLKLRLGNVKAGDASLIRKTISLGDTFVIESDEVQGPYPQSIAPWTLIGPDDLDIVQSREFSTQTFGQMLNRSNNTVETQTDTIMSVVCRGGTPPGLAHDGAFNEGTQTPHYHPPPPHGAAPHHSATSVNAPPLHGAAPHHSATSVNEVTSKDIFEKKKRKKLKHGNPRRDVSENYSDTPSSMTRRDILKYMLNQVKELKSQIAPESEQKDSSPKIKKKERRKYHGPVSAIESLGDNDPEKYAQRRLELMYRPAEPEARPRLERRHSLESLMSDRHGHEYLKSRHERPRDSRRDRQTSGRRAYTPPPVRRQSSPPLPRQNYRLPHRSMGREYGLPRRRLPEVPVRDVPPPGAPRLRSAYSPVPIAPMYQQPPVQNMPPPPGYPYGPPPPLMLPSQAIQPRMTHPQAIQPSIPQPTMTLSPMQNGQNNVFQPIGNMQPRAPMIQHNQSGTPMIFMPANQVQQAGQPPYILITSPIHYESVSDSNHGDSRDSSATKSHRRHVAQADMDTSLTIANKANTEMKHLAGKIHGKK